MKIEKQLEKCKLALKHYLEIFLIVLSCSIVLYIVGFNSIAKVCFFLSLLILVTAALPEGIFVLLHSRKIKKLREANRISNSD